ncbi:MAG: FHA domain-containing protein [Acidobacteriota bacterium]
MSDQADPLVVEVLDGPMDGAIATVDGDALRIGRSPDNGLPLHSDRSVSQRHAVLRRNDGEWLLEDLRSTNGTWLEGARLGAPKPVAEGQEFLVGNAVVRLRRGKDQAFLPDAETLHEERERLLSRLDPRAALGHAAAIGVTAQERRGFLTDRHLLLGLAAMNPSLAPFRAGGGRIGPAFLGGTLLHNEWWIGPKAWIERHLRAVRWEDQVAFATDVQLTPRALRVLLEAEGRSGEGSIGVEDVLRALLGDASRRIPELLARDGIDVRGLREELSKPVGSTGSRGRSSTPSSNARVSGRTIAGVPSAGPADGLRAVLAGRAGTALVGLGTEELGRARLLIEIVAFAGTVERFVVAMVNSLTPEGDSTKVLLLPGWRTSIARMAEMALSGQSVDADEARAYLRAVEGWLLSSAAAFQEAPEAWFRELWQRISPEAIEDFLSEGGRRKVYRIEAVELWEQYKKRAAAVNPSLVATQILEVVRSRAEERVKKIAKKDEAKPSRS